MKGKFKILLLAIIAIVLLASASVFFTQFYHVSSSTSEPTGNGSEEQNGTPSDGGQQNNSNNTQNQTGTHTVFVEEGTAGWCVNCPAVADILHELYEKENKNYRFYYVSLVHDENDKAQQRLDTDYTIYGFPTVFIDGGYKVIFGKQDKSVVAGALSAAASRAVPTLNLVVIAAWDNSTETLTITVIAENHDNEPYTGRLKVYLTEKISRWQDYDGMPYHFGFLDYIINQDITIPGKGNRSTSDTFDATDMDPDNLMVIAVLFNATSTKQYSDPPDNAHAFDAFFADATNATEVVKGGNLPPEVGIESPKKLRIHIFGNARRETPLQKNTILLGKTTIKAYAADDSKIEKVEFSVKGRWRTFNATDTEAPYEWTWHKPAFGKYTITVTAYDDTGKTSTASLDVLAFML
jgi:thiol-disulfide isomerase/thioredoxin